MKKAKTLRVQVTPKKVNRIEVLDSLRGMASLEVLIHHCLVIFPVFWAADFFAPIPYRVPWFLSYTPLHSLWAGHEAVVFFFVLSGFVLALPYVDGKVPAYRAYLIRRFCRIYIPYLAVLLTSLLLLDLKFCNRSVPLVSNAINSMWDEPFSMKVLVDTFFMLGDMHRVVPSAWSLVHEMRISIFFPLIVTMVMRFHWRMNLEMSLLLAVIGVELSGLNFGEGTQWGETVFYAALFVWGALFAKHRKLVIEKMAQVETYQKLMLLILALAFYNCRWLAAPLNLFLYRDIHLADVVIGIAAVLFIGMGLSWNEIRRLLAKPGLLWFGKVSYSLYLIHPMVLLISVYYLWPRLSIPGSIGVGFVSSFFLAWGFCKWVERPSINLGYQLSQKPLSSFLRGEHG